MHTQASHVKYDLQIHLFFDLLLCFCYAPAVHKATTNRSKIHSRDPVVGWVVGGSAGVQEMAIGENGHDVM